jgi:hypothetical protein
MSTQDERIARLVELACDDRGNWNERANAAIQACRLLKRWKSTPAAPATTPRPKPEPCWPNFASVDEFMRRVMWEDALRKANAATEQPWPEHSGFWRDEAEKEKHK